MWWRIAHAIVLLCSLNYSSISINGFLISNGNSIRYIQRQSYEKNMRVYTTSTTRHASSLLNDNTDEMVYTTANIDYSAANEYIRAHYNQSNYFATSSTQDGASSSIDEHQIYNGRVLQSSKYDNNTKEMLIDNGLAIIQSPLLPNDNSIDWSNMNDIQTSYLPKLESILHNLFPIISSYCFWNPMLRGTELEISRTENGNEIPTANIASLVHIDTDVGAHNIEDLINIVDKNKVQSSTQSSSNKFNKENVANDIIQNNRRFAIINFWRNIDEEPISNSPLAILASRYENETIAFPNQQPDMNKSKWYTFPYATHDEVIVFYQYDRNVQQPSDLWHCAISTPATESSSCTKPRKSFDIRAFVLLDECVPDVRYIIHVSLNSPLSSSSKKREMTDNQLITFHILLSAYAAALLVMGDRTKMPWLLELLFQSR